MHVEAGSIRVIRTEVATGDAVERRREPPAIV